MSVEAPRAVLCGSCSVSFDLSARNVRACRQRGEKPVCASCRHPVRKIDPATMEKLRRWWLDRYSLEELLELGRDLGWC